MEEGVDNHIDRVVGRERGVKRGMEGQGGRGVGRGRAGWCRVVVWVSGWGGGVGRGEGGERGDGGCGWARENEGGACTTWLRVLPVPVEGLGGAGQRLQGDLGVGPEWNSQ